MAPVRRSKRVAATEDDPNPSFHFQPNLDANAFSSPILQQQDNPTPQSPHSDSPLTVVSDSSPHSSRTRTASFTFLEPLTAMNPLFPGRRPSHITLNGRRSSRSQAARRVVSHSAKKPDGHIPRPPNCFLLYRSWVRAQNKLHGKISDPTGKKSEQNVSVIVGTLWEDLPEEKKDIFRAEARRLKEEHMKRYPGYRYAPRTTKKQAAEKPAKRVAKKMDPEQVGTCVRVANEIIGRSRREDVTSSPGAGPSNAPRSEPISFIPYRRSSSCPPAPPAFDPVQARHKSPVSFSPYPTARSRRQPTPRSKRGPTPIDIPVVYSVPGIGSAPVHPNMYTHDAVPDTPNAPYSSMFDPNYQPTPSYQYQQTNEAEQVIAQLEARNPATPLFDPTYSFPPPSYPPPAYPPPQTSLSPSRSEFDYVSPTSPLEGNPTDQDAAPMNLISQFDILPQPNSHQSYQVQSPLEHASDYVTQQLASTYTVDDWATAPHGTQVGDDNFDIMHHNLSSGIVPFDGAFQQNIHPQMPLDYEGHYSPSKANHFDSASQYTSNEGQFNAIPMNDSGRSPAALVSYASSSSTSSTPTPTIPTTHSSPYLVEPQPARAVDLNRISATGDIFFNWDAPLSSPVADGEIARGIISQKLLLQQDVSPFTTVPEMSSPNQLRKVQSPRFPGDRNDSLTAGLSTLPSSELEFARPSITTLGLGVGSGFGGRRLSRRLSSMWYRRSSLAGDLAGVGLGEF